MSDLEHPSVQDLCLVADALQQLAEEVVFVGGSTIPLLIPPLHASGLRVTDDVDCVVKVRTYHEYTGPFSERLRSLGFRECRDDGAPLCRWTIGQIRVDVMPCDEAALGLTNRWFDDCLANPQIVEVGGRRIRVPRPPALIATKLEAYGDRGKDPLGDTDIEDIVCLIAYRTDLVEEILGCEDPLKSYLIQEFSKLAALGNLEDVVSGCFSSDRVSQSVVPQAISRFRSIRDCRL